MENRVPVFVEFQSGSRIEQNYQEASEHSLPETTVVFSNGESFPLPTEQVVFENTQDGAAQVGFGGMSFEGISHGEIILCRVKDVLPDEWCSPHFDGNLKLNTGKIKRFLVDGKQVWPIQ
jgi:hypothetical protein